MLEKNKIFRFVILQQPFALCYDKSSITVNGQIIAFSIRFHVKRNQ
jgi:hypothetical protein